MNIVRMIATVTSILILSASTDATTQYISQHAKDQLAATRHVQSNTITPREVMKAALEKHNFTYTNDQKFSDVEIAQKQEQKAESHRAYTVAQLLQDTKVILKPVAKTALEKLPSDTPVTNQMIETYIPRGHIKRLKEKLNAAGPAEGTNLSLAQLTVEADDN